MPDVRAIGLFRFESEFREDGEQFAKRQDTKLPVNLERPSKVDAAFPGGRQPTAQVWSMPMS